MASGSNAGRSRGGSIVAAALAAILLAGLWAPVVVAQTWPRCVSGCTANDVTVTSLWLVAPADCTPGTPVSAQMWGRFQKNAMALRYCIYFVADIYMNGALHQLNFWTRVADDLPRGHGTFDFKLADITWTCGATLEVGNILVFWSTTPGCVDGDCSGAIPSKCYGHWGRLVVVGPLVANFNHDAPRCHCNTINFMDTTTGGTKPYTYQWDVDGNGTTDYTTQNPSHHYAGPGTYNVTLTVRDSSSPQRIDSQVTTVTIWANPVASFSATPLTGCAPLTVTFSDASISGSPNGGSIIKWEWDFDNNGVVDRTDTSAPGSFTRTYASPGTYSVSLRVTDANGCIHTFTRPNYITVQDCGADLAITKTVNNPTPNVGANVVFTVTVTNHGPSGATGVTVNDQLPSGYAYVSHTASQGTYTSGTGVWAVGSLANGASATLTLTATVQASGNYTNTASVTAATADPNPANNSASASTTPVAQADVSVVKSDSPDPVVAGTQLTYTLVVANAGPSNALNVVVTETYPAGFTYTTASPAPTTGNNVWALGTIAAGGSVTITITGTVGSWVLGDVQNVVTVASDTDDPNEANNAYDETTRVEPMADLLATKSLSLVRPSNSAPVAELAALTVCHNTPISVLLRGSDVDLDPAVPVGVLARVTIRSAGPSDAQNVVVTETYPSGFTFGSAIPAPTAGNNVWELGTLQAGSEVVIEITGTIAGGANGSVVNTVSVASATPDPSPFGNTATVTAEIPVQSLSFSIVGAPANGSVSGNLAAVVYEGPTGAAVEVIYTPQPGFVGEDTISYTVTDPTGAFAVGMIRITVEDCGEQIAGGGGALGPKIVINEIAWGGTEADPMHEWIELYSSLGEPVDLTGWTLRWRRKQPGHFLEQYVKVVELRGEIDEFGFYLMERQTDDVVSDVPADLIYEETGPVVITELAWGGTAASPDDQWIELTNVTGNPVALTGWTLRWRLTVPTTAGEREWKVVNLRGAIAPYATYLLERGSDAVVRGIPADLVYTVPLDPRGEVMELVDPAGNIVDTANAERLGRPGWASGYGLGNAHPHATMERVNPFARDAEHNWQANSGTLTRGTDRDGTPLVASPRAVNEQFLLWAYPEVDPTALPSDLAYLPFILELSDRGEVLELVDPAGNVVDTANADHPERDGWAAGYGLYRSPPFGTMERVDPSLADLDDNWDGNHYIVINGLDAGEVCLVATARTTNEPVLIRAAEDGVPQVVRRGEVITVAVVAPRLPHAVVTQVDGVVGGAGAPLPPEQAQRVLVGRRIEPTDNYQFQFATADLEPGTYRLWISLGNTLFRLLTFEIVEVVAGR